MSLIKFSFKLEPIWIWVFSLAPAVIGLVVLALLWLLR
jgi:hypothetical protein